MEVINPILCKKKLKKKKRNPENQQFFSIPLENRDCESKQHPEIWKDKQI